MLCTDTSACSVMGQGIKHSKCTYPSDIMLDIPKLLLHVILRVSQTILHVVQNT